MMNVHNLLDLYIDYLMVARSYSTATGLSTVTDQINHDQITRLPSAALDSSSTLWRDVKPIVHDIRTPEGLLIIDDSIQPKKHTKANPMIAWHVDHCTGKSVIGIKVINSFYYSPKYGMGLPIGAEFVTKDTEIRDQTRKVKRKSSETKYGSMCRMVKQANYDVGFNYVLTDRFSSLEIMKCIPDDCRLDFMAIKSNRIVALSQEDKSKDIFTSIEFLRLEGRTMSVYLKQSDKPVLIGKQVFKNGADTTGTLYLAAAQEENPDFKRNFDLYRDNSKGIDQILILLNLYYNTPIGGGVGRRPWVATM